MQEIFCCKKKFRLINRMIMSLLVLDLLNKGAVTVSEPVAPKDSFTGYIDAVSSEAILDGKDAGWRITLTLLRYDYGS